MADPVKKPAKPAKKKPVKAAAKAPKPAVATKPVVEKKEPLTLESLDARIRQLEEDDVVRASKRGIHQLVDAVKARYEENPALTVAVGVVLLILLVVIF